MLKKVIGYSLGFYLLIALVLSLAGVTSIDLMTSSNNFFNTVAYKFSTFNLFQFPKLNTIPRQNFDDIRGIINVLVFIANMFVVLVNVIGTLLNLLIQIGAFLFALFSLVLNANEIFKSSIALIAPTMIM